MNRLVALSLCIFTLFSSWAMACEGYQIGYSMTVGSRPPGWYGGPIGPLQYSTCGLGVMNSEELSPGTTKLFVSVRHNISGVSLEDQRVLESTGYPDPKEESIDSILTFPLSSVSAEPFSYASATFPLGKLALVNGKVPSVKLSILTNKEGYDELQPMRIAITKGNKELGILMESDGKITRMTESRKGQEFIQWIARSCGKFSTQIRP